MPVRTRRKKDHTKEQRQVLPTVGRIKEPEVDEYYYLSFLWRNTVDDFQDTVDLLKSKGLPFEWAKSPSNCMSFRISRDNFRKYEGLHKPANHKSENRCPAFMPYSCYKKEVLWQMEEANGFPYLYKDWTPVIPKQRRRRRA